MHFGLTDGESAQPFSTAEKHERSLTLFASVRGLAACLSGRVMIECLTSIPKAGGEGLHSGFGSKEWAKDIPTADRRDCLLSSPRREEAEGPADRPGAARSQRHPRSPLAGQPFVGFGAHPPAGRLRSVAVGRGAGILSDGRVRFRQLRRRRGRI